MVLYLSEFVDFSALKNKMKQKNVINDISKYGFYKWCSIAQYLKK